VLVVGVGGLGSPAALYLASAGVGTLGLVDHDDVEVSNLQRQIAHATDMAGTGKAASGAAAVARLNPHVRCVAHALLLTAATAAALVPAYDVVLDCTDNVATRYALNDACVRARKPLVAGAALRWEGQVRGPYPSPPPPLLPDPPPCRPPPPPACPLP
jgi:molybdopterin/thiamine biosynthesis adenylyltransferase